MRRLFLVFAVSTSASLFLPFAARAYCRMTTEVPDTTGTGTDCVEQGEFLAWKRRCFSYAIEEKGSTDIPMDRLKEVVAASFDAWEEVTCGDDRRSPGVEVRQLADDSMCDKAEYNDDGPNVNNIAFVESWKAAGYDPEKLKGAIALTTVWHNVKTGEIYDVDILVNEEAGPFAICPSVGGCTEGDPVPRDLQNVLTHEAGHFFGLAHSPFQNATMYWETMERGQTRKRILKTDDREGFCAIFDPPPETPAACELSDFTPKGGLSLKCGSKDGCNCSVPGAPNGSSAWGGVATLLVGLVTVQRIRRRRAPR